MSNYCESRQNKKNVLNGSDQPPRPPRLLSGLTLFKIAMRLFILEALWNPRNQQSIGLLSIINQALGIIYSESPEALKEARKRNLDFFNTNPITSGLVIGAVLCLEEDQSAGEVTPETDRKLVLALASTLAAEGDQFFWQSWLPLCCLTGVLITSISGFLWAPLLIPLLFCALAWPIRIWGVFKGYELGCDVYRIYQQSHGERLIHIVQWIWLLILVFLTSLSSFKLINNSDTPIWSTITWISSSIMVLWLYRLAIFGHLSFISYLLYPILIAIIFSLTLILV
jgi:mannose/fructose/N-acetylgalactosamine-specific phosphotransferase system component IID